MTVRSPRLRRSALRLQYATIAWNAGEAVLTIALGVAAGSLALVGFGTDSVIEIFASVVVVWHLRGEEHPHRTRRALRLVGVAFVLLAVALGVAAVRDLWTGREASESWPGIVYLAITAVVMFALAIAKRRVAVDLGDEPFAAEAEMTFLDGWLSTATLAGLLLNAVWDWWWADPLAGLLIAVIALREARESFEDAGEFSEGPA
ncbi:MAG TPA: cation transporter [Acidimicrobiia bacterium]|nr:cation transporter [Acidimicrobiia bacterium]